MPVIPPAVSTSTMRMPRSGPSAWPLIQSGLAQGMRRIVTRTSRMVMSVTCFLPYVGGDYNHSEAARDRVRGRRRLLLRQKLGPGVDAFDHVIEVPRIGHEELRRLHVGLDRRHVDHGARLRDRLGETGIAALEPGQQRRG